MPARPQRRSPPPKSPEKVALAKAKAAKVVGSTDPTIASLSRAMFAKQIPTNELWRTYYGGAVDMNRIEQALIGATFGQMRQLTDLEREMVDRDPHLGMLTQKRFGPIATVDYEVQDAKGEGINPEKAKLYGDEVRSQLAKIPRLRSMIFLEAWGLFDGRSALEVMWNWNLRRRMIEVKALGWIHPRRLSFGPERELRVVDSLYTTSYFPAVGEALRDYPYKFLEFRPHLFAEYPEREGLGPRSLYWAFFKRFTWRERMVLLELFGKPWRIIEIDKDAQVRKEDLADADEQIAALGGTQTARLPRGAKLNVPAVDAEVGKAHEATTEDVDEQMSKLWLGNTNTSDAKPGQGVGSGQAEVHERAEEIIFKRDLWAIFEAFEELSDAIVALNWGPDALDHAPRIMPRSEKKTDPGTEIDRLAKIVAVGVPISLAEVYERTGYKPPAPDEPVLKMTAAPTQEGGAPNPVARSTIVYPAGQAPKPGEVEVSPGAGGPPVPAEVPAEEPLDDVEQDPDEATLRMSLGFGLDHHEHVHCGKAPETVNGSPETLIEKGIRESARATGKWASELADAATGDTAGAILRSLTAAAARFDMAPLARSVERRMMHTLMLGALDSGWERENDQSVKPVAFAQPVMPGEPPIPPPAEPSFANKPYDAAVRWFRSKNVLAKADYEHLSAIAKQRAFTVAGMARDEMLRAVHDELGKQITSGADLRQFKQFAKERLESAGWTPSNPSHVENIFRTNVMSAYGAGRHAEMTQPAVLQARPYWQVLGVDDARTRATHKEVHGKVFRANDPGWAKAYPPFGYMCRERVRSLSEADLTRLGLKVSTWADFPGLPDPGFTSGTKSLLG